MLLVLDNGSEFTGELVSHLASLGAKYEAVSSYSTRRVGFDRYDSFILSGRQRNHPDVNAFNSAAIRYAVSQNLPLLGICYGAEILALTLGGTIRRTIPARGCNLVQVQSNPLCSGSLRVFESHTFEISRKGRLDVIGRSKDCECEMVRLGQYLIFGVQFHPEMSPDGRNLINRFVQLGGAGINRAERANP